MGSGKETKLTVLVVLLLVTSAVVRLNASEPRRVPRTVHLPNFLHNLDRYEHAGDFLMEEDIYRLLDLDDYTFTSYRGAYGPVYLYVGFYYTADKISAAHSPLACYPAQGWTINQPRLQHLAVGEHIVNFAEIIARQQGREELVRYWFQAYHATTPHGRMNKLNALCNKLLRKKERHAFVRVAVPVSNSDYDQARIKGTEFMKSFYPRFIEFIDASADG